MGINEELRQERILASYERTVERLESEVAKLKADRHKLVELVRTSYRDLIHNGGKPWEESYSKQRLDEITGEGE